MTTELDVPDNLEDDPRIRRIIWKGLGSKSTREMAQETGLTFEQVQRVKVSLIDEVDILSVVQMRAKVLADLQEFARVARDDYDNVDERNKAGLLNSAISALDKVMREANRVNKGEQEQVDRLNGLRIRELLALMTEVVEVSVQEIADTYGLDEDELFDIFNGRLTEAARKRDTE